MPRGNRQFQALVALLLLAAVLRLAACIHWSGDLSRDPDAYAAYAERLAATGNFVAPDGHPTAFRPPLYPLMLAAVETIEPVWGVAVLHVVLGVATVALTISLGRRLDLGAWSLLAGLLVACDPLLLRYTPQVMTEVTCTFLAVLVLWLAAARRPFLLGLAFGLATLSRPTFWAFGALTALAWAWQAFQAWRLNTSPTRLRGIIFREALLAVAGVAIVVLPWAVRNTVAFGRPILTTTHGGYTLLLANNPVFWREVVDGPPGSTWNGESLGAWQRSLEAVMADEGIPPDDELARDRWMKDRAIGNILGSPDQFLWSAVYRLHRFCDVSPLSAALPRPMHWSVAAFYVAVFALAIAGLVRLIASIGWKALLVGPPLLWGEGSGVRGVHRRTSPLATVPTEAGKGHEALREQPQTAPLTPGPSPQGEGRRREEASWLPALLLILAFTAVHAVYWTDTRMRAPLVPAVALLAARAFLKAPDRQSRDRQGAFIDERSPSNAP